MKGKDQREREYKMRRKQREKEIKKSIEKYCNNQESNIYIYIYIYVIYINRLNLEKIQLNFTIEVEFCIICPKLFIFREFYFLIFELNIRSHHKYLSK